ncbi:DUF6879 family protein, partial [Haloechinothrix alba]|uniref:DUF6879 family protein n=1 Tax=Haloechinothrix alba TaxID=664784 RepID=UPI001C3DDC58
IDRLWEGLTSFRYSLFRLETLQQYSGSSEDEAVASWRRTGTVPLTEELRQWCERIQRRVNDGRRVQRVHVVRSMTTSARPQIEASITGRSSGWPNWSMP